jgi:hypothetical protein
MLQKYRRPTYREQAKSYQERVALGGPPSVAEKTANVRKTVMLLYAAIAVYALVFVYLGYRFGTFEFILSPLIQGKATVLEKTRVSGPDGPGFTLRVAIDAGLEHTILAEARVDASSWAAVSPGTKLRCAYKVNNKRDKAHIVELVFVQAA